MRRMIYTALLGLILTTSVPVGAAVVGPGVGAAVVGLYVGLGVGSAVGAQASPCRTPHDVDVHWVPENA